MTDEQFPYGLMVAGTTAPREIIGALLRTLAKIDKERHERLVLSQPIPPHVFDEGDSSRWWESQAAREFMFELRDLVASYAPKGYYLGFLGPDPDPEKVLGHMFRDRLLFGFWPEEMRP